MINYSLIEEKIDEHTDVKYQLAAIAATIENFLDHPQESKEMGDPARQLIPDNYT